MLPDRDALAAAEAVVYRHLSPTPQYAWPLLRERLGAEVWVKHENHLPVGAFKVRGGLVYLDDLVRSGDRPARVVSATRGNHGQSLGFAGRIHGLPVTIVVPHGNSREKNAAMRALGVELIEHGEDFQLARELAEQLAAEHGWHLVPSFDRRLVAGVATYGLELLRAVPDLDTVYVPIGLGSGLCGVLAARAALGHRAEVVGVVSSLAPAYVRSLTAGRPVAAPATTRFADGMAARVPDASVLAELERQGLRVLEVGDDEVAEAMALLYQATHNVAEGAGAAALAGLMQERERQAGRKAAVVLSGGNVDRELFAEVLTGGASAEGGRTC